MAFSSWHGSCDSRPVTYLRRCRVGGATSGQAGEEPTRHTLYEEGIYQHAVRHLD